MQTVSHYHHGQIKNKAFHKHTAKKENSDISPKATSVPTHRNHVEQNNTSYEERGRNPCWL